MPFIPRGMSNTVSSTYSTSPTSLTPDQFSLNTPTNDYDPGAVKLSEVLTVLDQENESNILIVRRISKLGYRAQEALAEYFSNFGIVRRILLLPSRGKGDSRNRPASMGFVVMERREDCARICRIDNYRVGFVDIQVQKFVRNAKVQVMTDGYTVANAYIPSSHMGDHPMSSPRLDRFPSSELNPIVNLADLELLAESMVQALGL